MEEKVLSGLDTVGLTEFARKLIQIQSINPPADYSEISSFLQGTLTSFGMETRILEGSTGKKNVFGLVRGSGPGCALLLSGHMDVVPAGDIRNWTHDPFGAEIHDGWLWGRGAVDMKAALAAQIYAAKVVIDSGADLSSAFMLGCTVDDETAGAWGMKYAVERGLTAIGWPRPSLHILGEANDLNITTSFKGRLWLRISTRGKAAHGGQPDLGVNAIDQMVRLVHRLRSVLKREHPLMGEDTMNLGILQGGEKVNIVPESCTAHIDLRMCSPGTADEYERALRGVIEELKKEEPGLEVSEFEIYERRDPMEMSTSHPAIGVMKEGIRSVSRKEARFLGTLSAGDLYHTMKIGIPGAWIGPGNAQLLHQVDERIQVSQIVEAAKIYALLILRFCGLSSR
jgi:succinyl-diaminopimelate desuccinylase